MNKKRVVMVDFWSVCDEKGKPIGHGAKAGNEYYDYLADKFNVIQYTNESMLQHLKNPGKVAFAQSLRKGIGKAKRVFTNFECLHEIYSKESDSIIWFYVPDIYLFLFILLSVKGKRRIAVNVFEEYLGNRAKHWIFLKALKKIDVVFVTNPHLFKAIPNGILIPDYAYKEQEYSRYYVPNKKEQAVCLGTMNEKKKLQEVVEAFSENGYPLYIAGQFSSLETYKRLCEIKSDNIIIENRYVDSEEYYRLLASSRFCLLPYDAVFYKNRTSGVIQECLFMDTIPVSHKEILEFSNIRGVGYEDIHELATINFSNIDGQLLLESYEMERNRFYRYDIVKNKVVEAIAHI